MSDLPKSPQTENTGKPDNRAGERAPRDVSGGLISSKAMETARQNSRLGAYCAVIATLVSLSAIAFSSFIQRTRNHVAAIPVGQVWEYPSIHWMNTPNSYQEDAKPLHVALKYVRGMYEVDPVDFTSTANSGAVLMLSNRIAELLAYTKPGTKEYTKVNEALEKSQTTFQMYNECKCVKRFLVSDMMVSAPPLATLRIEMIGRFVIFGQDGRRPIPAEDLGFKSISLYMASDIQIFDRAKDDPDGAKVSKDSLQPVARAVNPEGWFVMKSYMSTLKPEDVKDLRQIRIDAGMKGAY